MTPKQLPQPQEEALQSLQDHVEQQLRQGEAFQWDDFLASCAQSMPESERQAILETLTGSSAFGGLSLERDSLVQAPVEGALDQTLNTDSFLEDEPPSQAPKRGSFGEYELLKELGSGGMGVVWLAHQSSLDRKVALKMLHQSAQQRPGMLQRFEQEARAVANLRHPHIISIYEVGEHEGQPFFSMEYIQGQELGDLVRQETLPIRRCAELMMTIAEAIATIHDQGLIHRDLKPSNILIDTKGAPVLMDFGIAKQLDVDDQGQALTQTGMVIGTPGYIAPELLPPKNGQAGPLSDIYSLGAVFYKMLTARAPYEGESAVEILRQSIESAPLPPRLLRPKLPEDLEAICLKCLEREPKDRYENASALIDDLTRFLEGTPVLARPRSAFSHIARLLTRSTEHRNLMALWGPIWRINAIQFFVLFALSQALYTSGMWNNISLCCIWLVGFASVVWVLWYYRLRKAVRFSTLEHQMVRIFVIFAINFFLIAIFNGLMLMPSDGTPAASYQILPPFYLMPIVQLETGVAFACMAVVLGGEFFIMALPCALLSFVVLLLPQWAFLIYGTSLAAGMLIPFLRTGKQTLPALK